MKEPALTISAVERDVGLSKDVLRVWERRYGFPVPQRDAKGERLYPADQVRRLRLVKRLMDLGHRPGRLLSAPEQELEALSTPAPSAKVSHQPPDPLLHELIALLRGHDEEGFLQAMRQQLARQGLGRFVQDTVAPMAEQVGRAWAEGRLRIFEEHLFTELCSRVLRQAIATVPVERGPRVLLTSLPNEQHALGLLMVEALLALDGARCIALGTQTPLLEVAQAASAHHADVVALSFSAAFPQRQVAALLTQLREALPAGTQLWAGGGGVRRVNAPDGVTLLHSLSEAVEALARTPRPG